MTDTPDFDALAHAAHTGTSKVGEREFVRAALTLDAWYLIGVAPDDAPDEPEPLIAAIDRAPHLLVFTDEERAAGFARARAKKRAEPEPAPVLHMGPADALGYMDDLRTAGVDGVHFNDGEHSVSLTLVRALEIARST
jgi:hypothetical protein